MLMLYFYLANTNTNTNSQHCLLFPIAQEEGEEQAIENGTHRLPLETHCTQPLGRARGDEPQGRWQVEGEGREAGEAA